MILCRPDAVAKVAMVGDGLFEDLPEVAAVAKAAGAARLREPVRDQIELRAVDLEALIGADHAARTIWAYVETLDLGALEDAVRARSHTPGQAPVSPRLLLALWLYATSQAVGSARSLAKLCTSHDAYRWLCGGVSVNYHGLSGFRTGHPELFDRLLSEHLASLSTAGVINLDEVVQDGMRVRASAGSGSYRRRKTLRKELKKATRLVARLSRESADDPDASNRRIEAARRRGH
jgi:transposase